MANNTTYQASAMEDTLFDTPQTDYQQVLKRFYDGKGIDPSDPNACIRVLKEVVICPNEQLPLYELEQIFIENYSPLHL